LIHLQTWLPQAIPEIAKYLTADNSVFSYSNANDMCVTQDLNSFREIIAHAHCSVDETRIKTKNSAIFAFHITLNSDGKKFHKYQQNKQLAFT
jgi:hypothetical protein